MKDKAMEIGARMKETVQHAQKQIQGFEEDVQKFVSNIQERLVNTPIEQAKKVDDLLRTVAVKDFVEKIRAVEMFKQGQAVRKELLERFGLVAADDVEVLNKKVSTLQKKFNTLSRKKTPVTMAAFTALEKRLATIEKKAAPAKKKAAKKK